MFFESSSPRIALALAVLDQLTSDALTIECFPGFSVQALFIGHGVFDDGSKPLGDLMLQRAIGLHSLTFSYLIYLSIYSPCHQSDDAAHSP